MLAGPKTPVGKFQLMHVQTPKPAYGGDVLGYHIKGDAMYSVHRVILTNPAQRRLQRLASPNVADRLVITDGCINVMPQVFQALVDCCSNDQIEVIR